jgi:mRNA interferase RelE/StbE
VAGYRVDIMRAAEKDLSGLSRKDHRRVVSRIAALTAEPRPHGYEKISGAEKYRLRQGDYRIVYRIDDDQRVVTIVKIGHRRDVYR